MKELKREISKKYTLALLAIALLNCTSFCLLQVSQKSTDSFAVLINKSGRQRMLSQRISLIITQLSHNTDTVQEKVLMKELHQGLELFEKSHNILIQKSTEVRYEIPKPLKEHYFGELHVDQKVKHFIARGKQLLHHHSNTDPELLREFVSYNKSTLLLDLNTAVKLLENAANKMAENIKFLQIAIFITSLIALIIILLIVFKPMERMIMANQDELKRARNKADEENRYKSLFLANMSHELRTPLNGVLGVADLLASTQLTTEQRDYLQVIDQSGNTLLAIINDILDATKIEMNALKLENRDFLSAELCDSLEKIFHYQFLGKHVSLKFEVDGLPQALKGDEHRLKQVLTNLLSNALKFTERGGVTLKLSFNESTETLNFKVIDTGVGIEPKHIEGIFEPFKQEDNSTTRVYGGTGLGLTITKELVTAMGGEIQIDSAKGQGSTFHGFIKMKKGNLQVIKKIKPLKDGLRNAHVLIVDDNAINLKLLKRLLEKENLTTVAASSGAEAIEAAQAAEFQLILMDYHMPNMNGVEASKMIFEKLGNKAPDIICLTADLSEQARKNAEAAGIVEVIEKPIRKNKLVEILARYIS